MSDYKLVPVEPTPEMIDAAAEAYMPFGDMELVLRVALLAAPAVQGEPVSWLLGEVCGGDASHNTVNVVLDDPAPWSQLPIGSKVSVQPQPAEQQPAPDVAGLVEALDLALEYWRDRQQRYKNRRPKWVVAAELALAAYRKGAKK